MDGVFTLCTVIEGCTRMDQHDGGHNLTFTLRAQGAPSVMRDLARRLDAGAPPAAVAAALRHVAERLS